MLIPSYDIQNWIDKSKNLEELNNFFNFYVSQKASEIEDRPTSFGVDAENALIVYLTPDLYKYLEEMDKEQDVNLISLGKLYLKIKKFFSEGRFKRV